MRSPYVFGICGHGNVGMLDALYERRDQIQMISPRHEQVAAHMADAYFRVKHKPVATLTSCGPGSCNIVHAAGSARWHRSSSADAGDHRQCADIRNSTAAHSRK